MHIQCMHFHQTFIAFWIYFWHLSLIQQSRNVSKSYHFLVMDSPVSLDLFKDLNDISLYKQFIK